MEWINHRSKEREGVRLTARIGLAPEDDGPVLVAGDGEDLVEEDGEAVEMADVEGAKVGVEGIVSERPVEGEVDGRLGLGRGQFSGRSEF